MSVERRRLAAHFVEENFLVTNKLFSDQVPRGVSGMDDSTKGIVFSSRYVWDSSDSAAVWVFYLDVVQDELVPLLGRGHLAVGDGLS